MKDKLEDTQHSTPACGNPLPGWLIVFTPLAIIILLFAYQGLPWMTGHSTKGARGEAMNLIETGRMLIKQGQVAEASAQFDAAVLMCPEFPEAHLAKGLLMSRLNRNDEAIQSFKRAVDLNPPKVEVIYNNIGMSYYQSGDFESAREWFYRAAQGKVRQQKIWRNVAMVETDLNHPNEAIQAFQHVIELKPTIQNLYLDMLAEAIDEAGYEELNDTLKQMWAAGTVNIDFTKYYAPIVVWNLENDKSLAEDYSKLGLIYQDAGDYTNALDYYDLALEINGADLMTLKRMGVTLIRTGRISEAEGMFQKVLSLSPNDAGALKAMQMLRSQFDDEQLLGN